MIFSFSSNVLKSKKEVEKGMMWNEMACINYEYFLSNSENSLELKRQTWPGDRSLKKEKF